MLLKERSGTSKDKSEKETSQDMVPTVTMNHFLNALKKSRASIMPKDRLRYKHMFGTLSSFSCFRYQDFLKERGDVMKRDEPKGKKQTLA